MRLLSLFFLVLACIASCQGDLSESLEGKGCGANYECLTGYECDKPTNVCVPIGSATEPLECRANEVMCGDHCADLQGDELDCGGCGATCSAPEHAAPTCVLGVCKISCVDQYD